MKKMFMFLAMAVMLCVGVKITSYAGELFNVSVGTYDVTDTLYCVTEVTGTIDMSNIIISNSGATQQTIDIYKLGASTTTISKIATVVIPASAGYYRPFGDLNYNDRINVTDVAFRKSSTATDVYIVGIYH
jgi:hypothetical protein